MGAIDLVNELVLDRFPDTQALYLFGSARTILARGDGGSASASVGGDRAPQGVRRQGGNTNDIDLALLLPPLRAKEIGTLAFSDLRFELEKRLGRDVDLINLRRSSTVFQNEVIASGEVILLCDRRGLDEFEMLTLSYYQKLNEERAEILKEFFAGGRAYRV